LTLQRVQQFFNEKLKAGNSPALVRYLRVVLRTALNEALLTLGLTPPNYIDSELAGVTIKAVHFDQLRSGVK